MRYDVLCMDLLFYSGYIVPIKYIRRSWKRMKANMNQIERVELSQLLGLDYSLKHVLAHMHYWREGSNWIIQESGRPNTAIMAPLSIGADYIDVHTREILASACPGDIVIIPQGSRYEFQAHNIGSSMTDISNLPGGNFYWDGVKNESVSATQVANAVFLGFEMTTENNRPLTVGSQIKLIRSGNAQRVFQKIESIARISGKGLATPALINAKTYELLTMLGELELSSKPRNYAYRKIEPALQRIDREKIGAVTVAELARICSMSQSSFRKLFLQEMNMPPSRYMQERKFNRAVSLLQNSELSILEIAMESGFQDMFYFSRFFRKMTGMSPTQWRDSRSRNEIPHDVDTHAE